jgi:hypothetical protein
MRLWLVLACGCSSSHTAAIDAHADQATCLADREAAIDRTCTVPGDCVLVTSADCCGPIDLAVKVGTEGGFPAVESAYETCLACPPLGCAHQTEAENGSPAGAGTIVATCMAGRCTSVVQ